jgi:hypothetical protein
MRNDREDAILQPNTRKSSIKRTSSFVAAEAFLRVVCEEMSDSP